MKRTPCCSIPKRMLTVQGPGKIEAPRSQGVQHPAPGGEGSALVRASTSTRRVASRSMRGWSIPAQGKDYEVKQTGHHRDRPSPASTAASWSGHAQQAACAFRRRVRAASSATKSSRNSGPTSMTRRMGFPGDRAGSRGALSRCSCRRAGRTRRSGSIIRSSSRADRKRRLASGAGWLGREADQAGTTACRRGGALPASMAVSLLPPGGQGGGFQSWQEIGTWYLGLTQGRRDASPRDRAESAAS